MLQAVVDAFAQPDIRRKLLFTMAMLVVFRFVAHVPVPSINTSALDAIFRQNAVLGFLNIFSGGALENMSVAALGVYPYITASIVMQLLVPLVPSLQALSKEGEQGRRQIQIYTYWLAVPMAMVQGYGQLFLIQQLGGISGIGLTGADFVPTVAAIASLTAGTMFLVWLGDLITENGIGNGISIIIVGGIIAGLPRFIGQEVITTTNPGTIVGLGIIILALLYFIVVFQEGQRRIPVQYARSLFRGGRMYRQSGQTHIPLRVNSAGMIPLIFAFSIMIFPSYAASIFASSETGWIASAADGVRRIFDPTSGVYWGILFLRVVIFTFFYTMVVFQQQNLAENLQRQGGFIPGIRPGRPTAHYLTRVITRITWGGAIFLGIVAVVPFLASGLPGGQALSLSGGTTFGSLTITGTGLLIVVAVVLDTMRQLEAQLLMRRYEGFIR
ncbi:MAG: preprotein translocase subunit SecY [Dehalococcoidia bacterium]